jgi:PAS domain S-box-containing protein
MWCLYLTGTAAITAGIWRLGRPVNKDGVMKSAPMASLVDSGQSLCDELGRVVEPAIKRTQLLASDPRVIHALLSGSAAQQTQLCNSAITQSTEIDALAMFDAVGKIVAINTVYASGQPIQQSRVDHVLKLNFGGRDVIQKCVRNASTQSVLQFQTTCDITPALFDSTGLSVAYSVPVYDPQSGLKIGVVSSRIRFERLTALIEHRAIGGVTGTTQFVTDDGGYFSEEINSGRQAPPIPQKILAGVVQPLVRGDSEYCFTQQGSGYLCIFKMKQFTTLAGGGIQVMVLADEQWLLRELRQAKFFNCGVLIAAGLFLFLCAICLRSMASLKQSEKWNRLLIESAMDSVIAVDDLGVVRAWNPQAQLTFGYSTGQACGKRLADLILPTDGEKRYQITTEPAVLSADFPTIGKRMEMPLLRLDGRQIVVEMVVTPVQVGHAQWRCVFAHDVTEQRDIELHLAQSQKLESIGQMAAGIAHEINTPTQYVGDNTRFVRDSFMQLKSVLERHCQLLRADASPRPWSERCDEIEQLRVELDLDFLLAEIPKALDQSIDGLQSISKIVGAMKEFSHPGGQNRQPADLNAAIQNTMIVCRNRWRGCAELILDLDPNIPSVPVVVGEFNQVMLNLIVNAADAISGSMSANPTRKGRIVISTRHVGAMVEIRVQDNGPGIQPAAANKIFEPFFTTKAVGKGTGQGLMLSRNLIVKKHGGELRFESAAVGGTVFIVRLPVEVSRAIAREAA